eukprot:6031505-Ditylum_brightwellii.AAC.1
MSQWVMTGNGNVVPCQTLRPLIVVEINSETKIRNRKLFDSMIERRWDSFINSQTETTPNNWDPYEESEGNDEIARSLPEVEETVDENDTLINQ